MAWKPWYERMAEIDSADERAAFINGVFGGPKPPSAERVAGTVLMALMAGVGGYAVGKSIKDRNK